MNKPIIGIATTILRGETGTISGVERAILNMEYVSAVEKAGGIPMLLPVLDNEEDIKRLVDMCDGILLSGGHDINPIVYGDEPHKSLGAINTRVDFCQISIAKRALEMNKAILGICRGEQLLNVVCGGDLYQDMSQYGQEYLKHVQEGKRYDSTHNVYIEEDSILHKLFGEKVPVNSYHHQAVRKLGAGLKVTARAKDGIVEAIEMVDREFVVGVQWHPEIMLVQCDSMMPLFRKLIEKSEKRV